MKRILGAIVLAWILVPASARAVERKAAALQHDKWLHEYAVADSLPVEKIRLLIDKLYARHGKPFEDPARRAYFSKQAWYKEDPEFDEDSLPLGEAALVEQLEELCEMKAAAAEGDFGSKGNVFQVDSRPMLDGENTLSDQFLREQHVRAVLKCLRVQASGFAYFCELILSDGKRAASSLPYFFYNEDHSEVSFQGGFCGNDIPRSAWNFLAVPLDHGRMMVEMNEERLHQDSGKTVTANFYLRSKEHYELVATDIVDDEEMITDSDRHGWAADDPHVSGDRAAVHKEVSYRDADGDGYQDLVLKDDKDGKEKVFELH